LHDGLPGRPGQRALLAAAGSASPSRDGRRVIAAAAGFFVSVLLALQPVPGSTTAGRPVQLAAANGEGQLAPESAGVLVETNLSRYGRDDIVVVTIFNRLRTPITTGDQRSFCSILSVERRHERDGEWREIRNCYSGVPVSQVTLEPSSRTEIRLDLSQDPAGGMTPGWHRIALSYLVRERPGDVSQAPHAARSKPFQIE
jgi:hypothetical protein